MPASTVRRTKVSQHVASEATGVSGLAGRYATALFDLADDRHALDAVAGDLDRLDALIAESADLRRVLRSPVIGRKQQEAALARLVKEARIGALAGNFVLLVARNGRLFALPKMIADYRLLLAAKRGEVAAEVIAAQPLSDAQVKAVTEQLRAATGAPVNVKLAVDPAIIGGLIVKVGSRMVDASLSTKLQRLQLAMRGI